MPSEESEALAGEAAPSPKTVWQKPAVATLDAWEAENADGSGTETNSFLS